MPPPEETWLSRDAASIYLNRIGCPTSVRTLEMYASRKHIGKGPPFVRSSWKAVRYLQADLDAWAKKRMVRVG